MIASVAYKNLDESTREYLKSLIPVRTDVELENWMVSKSTWADTDGGDHAMNHFVHVTKCDDPEKMRLQCGSSKETEGKCVTEALVNHIYTAISKRAGEPVRDAIKYLIHYIGDIHQPLHVALAADFGGNTLHRIRPFLSTDPVTRRDRSVNLHEIWDFSLFDNAISKRTFYETEFESVSAGSLDFGRENFQSAATMRRHVHQIAFETAGEVTCRSAYFDGVNFVKSDDFLTPEYIQQGRRDVVKQVLRAGVRLAHLLTTISRIRIDNKL